MRGLLLVLLVALVSCAPRNDAVPASEPIFYNGSKDDVYAAVVQAISTSPGINNSNGWIISQLDAAGGFVRAETAITKYILGFPQEEKEYETISVVVSAGQNGTQVVIQLTKGAKDLANRVQEQLDQKFNRL